MNHSFLHTAEFSAEPQILPFDSELLIFHGTVVNCAKVMTGLLKAEVIR